jgi:hypothetical protein
MVAKATAQEKDGRLVLRIPCKYEGHNTRRYGETTFKFRIDEQFLPDSIKAIIGVDKPALAVLIHKQEKLPVGKVSFGGMRIDRTGESVLSLDTTAEDVRLPFESISGLADEEIQLILSIRIAKGDS